MDVRNSRGKFDEIKRITLGIIMLQCLRLYTLGSRGSRELKTFLETRLISSRVDQKLKNKEGEYMLFKEGNWPEFVGHWSVCGCNLQGSWEQFLRATS